MNEILGVELNIGDMYKIDGGTYWLTSYEIEWVRDNQIKGYLSFTRGWDEIKFEFEHFKELIEEGRVLRVKLDYDTLRDEMRDVCITPNEVYLRDLFVPTVLFDEVKQQLPTKVFFNDKKGATTLIDGDNVSVVKTTKGDKFSKEYGFLLAYFQMYSGLTKTQANKYLKDLVKDE